LLPFFWKTHTAIKMPHFAMPKTLLRVLLVLGGLLVGGVGLISLFRLAAEWQEITKGPNIMLWCVSRLAMVVIGLGWSAGGVFFERVARSGLFVVESLLVAYLILLATALPEVSKLPTPWFMLCWVGVVAVTVWALPSYRHFACSSSGQISSDT
jgi:hypothetical protein